jgi:hypothetical protein
MNHKKAHNNNAIFIEFFSSLKKLSILIILFLFIFTAAVSAQEVKTRLEVRLPVQYERQKEIINYGPPQTQKASAINFGIDALIKFQFVKVTVSGGVGYFRNRFNIKRPYDHTLLNRGRDSLAILTTTFNYTYSLLRFPLGIEYPLVNKKNMNVSIGLEYFLNFSFKQKYNGGKPFKNANNSHYDWKFYGNSSQLFISFLIDQNKKHSIYVQPYIRLLNTYNEDLYLFERNPETNKKKFDAFGLAFKCDINL